MVCNVRAVLVRGHGVIIQLQRRAIWGPRHDVDRRNRQKPATFSACAPIQRPVAGPFSTSGMRIVRLRLCYSKNWELDLRVT